MLFLTGANDPRVDPVNSRKMTARLQASGTKQPVLLRTSSSSGHGIGTALDERIAQTADVYAFLCATLKVQIQRRLWHRRNLCTGNSTNWLAKTVAKWLSVKRWLTR